MLPAAVQPARAQAIANAKAAVEVVLLILYSVGIRLPQAFLRGLAIHMQTPFQRFTTSAEMVPASDKGDMERKTYRQL